MSRKNPSLCHTPHCKKAHEPNRTHCSGCRKRAYRKGHVIEAALQNLRNSADKRGIFFDLTLPQFKEFCIETEYLVKKGRSKLSYTVDRKIEGPLPGYTYSNIQCLTRSQNSQKEQERRRVKKYLQYDWQSKTAKVVTITRQEYSAANPF